MSNKDLSSIATHYVTTAFFFDVIATVPSLLIFNESLPYFWLKLFRLCHFFRITEPLSLILSFLL